MYEMFKTLLDEADCLGKIINATMCETYASIEIVYFDGRKISLTMTIRED